ncbi:MAG: DUF4397 domain-containing protein [Candidatus Limnocylindrales bacterium]
MRTRTSRSARFAILAAAAMLALLAAAPAAAAEGDAHVRVLHGSPDAPSVDVYVDGAKVDALSGLEFGDLTDYVALPGGTYAVKVCATADATICPIDVPALDVSDDTKYTIAATNVLASIEAQVLVDAPAPSAEKTQVRVVHFSADTPAVDVLTQDGSATVVDNVAYPNATGYLTLDPGSYDLKVCADADNTVCPLDPGALDLAAGRSYSVFAIGSLAGETLTAAVGVDGVAAPATDTVATTQNDATTAGLPLAVLAMVGLVAFVGTLRLTAVRARR